MKFAQIVKGKRAEEPIEVPGFFDEAGKPFVVLAVPLTGLEYQDACAFARAQAVEKGAPNPGLGEPVYDLALMAYVLFIGTLDPDSPEKARTHSFSNAQQILSEMSPEDIVYLHERHELWQNQCSPNVHTFEGGDDGFYAAVAEVAGPEGRATFMRFSPSMRVSFSLSTARILKGLWDSQRARSTSGAPSEKTETSDASETPTPSEPSKSDDDSSKTNPSDP